MMRLTLGGDELSGFAIADPAASVRLLLPVGGELVMPTWERNVFLLPDGGRAPIRTFTPRRFDTMTNEVTLDVVIHEAGAASDWVQRAGPGDPAALSGPGRGYTVDPAHSAHVLAGDETAIPAIGQLLEALPYDQPIHAVIEIRNREARLPMPHHPLARVDWLERDDSDDPGDVLMGAITGLAIEPGTAVWAAGEAASMYLIRQHLFDEREVPGSAATVRGYWKLRE
jgi:NADPH-dependent ferric siderophore reductase